jgi:hypothetical protein
VRVTHRASADGETVGVHMFGAGAGVSKGEAFLVDAIVVTEGAGPDAGRPTAECEL